MAIDGSAIILGFTGSIGSGCTYIAKDIPSISDKEYHYFKLSQIIRDELKKVGKTSPSVAEMQNIGNELRQDQGNDVLAVSLIASLNDEKKYYEYIIIDGIKNDSEVDFLRQFPNFYLFSVNADREIREERLVGPGKPFDNPDDFQAADTKDEFEEGSNGQQVKKCSYAADIIIVNEDQIPTTAKNVKQDFIINNIIRRYVQLIENNVSQNKSYEISPSVNELCMTMAYAMSKKSSCLKRKVGSIIIDSPNSIEKGSDIEKAQRVPSIIASGYNEVPEGAYKCIFDHEYQKCYRDHLQEIHAEKMLYCPTCGHKIDIKITCQHCGVGYTKFVKDCQECKREVKAKYICPKCNKNVFDEHLPGSKNTPGKLLDLCRALHAEEMAILQLSKRGGKGAEDLVLFATTQPCNLCANKIATAGIKKVVYAEPYNMKESAEILKSGGVELERFEGVKSSAYFKLYN